MPRRLFGRRFFFADIVKDLDLGNSLIALGLFFFAGIVKDVDLDNSLIALGLKTAPLFVSSAINQD